MSDTIDGGGFFDEIPPEDERREGPFRSRQELEAENARLRAELQTWRQENALLADMLARRFEEESGELCSEEPEGEGGGAPGDRFGCTSSFVISEAAIDLFEALPEAFTLDEALDAAEQQGQSSTQAAHHLRAYLRERMVVQRDQGFTKTARKPYF